MDSNHYQNNFDFLRFVAASMVIISHSFPLTGLIEPKLISGATLGYLGISIFFITSGFLITKSWDQEKIIKSFIWKRFLRIIPGLIFASIIVTFIIGPLVTTFNLIDYIFNIQTYRFFFFSLFFPAWNIIPFDNLPGVFMTNPLSGFVNGPLWTLVYEEGMYMLVIIFGIIGFLYKKIIMIPLILSSFGVLIILHSIYSNMISIFVPGSLIGVVISGLTFFCYFFIASLFYLNNKNNTYSIKIFLILAIIFIISSFTVYFQFLAVIILPYIVLFIAHQKIPHINKFGKYGDFSYGMYIVAWPIQQVIVLFFPGLNIMYYIAFCFLFTFPLAYISWNFIESKALSRKKNLPRFQFPFKYFK
jgi:peptidoglycan/LPS O-acetylase OafA/YrhL